MSEPSSPKVVDLVGAGVPADQGLSALGLVMQLSGNVFAAAAALVTFVTMIEPRTSSSSSSAMWLILVLGLSVARSILHMLAGSQLVHGHPAQPGTRFQGVKRYIVFGLAQSVALGAIFDLRFHVGHAMALALTTSLAVWPGTLAVLSRLPRFRRFEHDLPVTEDKGFEGASILMTVLGACGLLGTGTAVFVMLQLDSRELQRGPNVLIVLSLVLLGVRSVIHMQAGLSGLRETSVDRAVELANRYANFGVISSFCGAGALLLFVMSGSVSVSGLALVCGIGWMLITWPIIVRRFFSDRQFADLLAGDAAPVHRRAPDAGLTWLGWLLVAWAALALALQLPTLAADPTPHAGFHTTLLPLGERSAWWGIGLALLQGWAGFELVRMSVEGRIIATIYGLVGLALAVYINWPLLTTLRHTHGMDPQAIAFAPVALQLVLPIATLLLVHRTIAPTARARFRSK